MHSENHQLLTEEEKLKVEADDIRRRLLEYREMTKKEVEDTQNMKREQQRHKMKINKLKKFIADTVLNKTKEIIKKKKEDE